MTVSLLLVYINTFVYLYLGKIQAYLEIWFLAAAAPLHVLVKTADFPSKFSKHLLQDR